MALLVLLYIRIIPRWSSWFATCGDMSDSATQHSLGLRQTILLLQQDIAQPQKQSEPHPSSRLGLLTNKKTTEGWIVMKKQYPQQRLQKLKTRDKTLNGAQITVYAQNQQGQGKVNKENPLTKRVDAKERRDEVATQRVCSLSHGKKQSPPCPWICFVLLEKM